MRKPTRRTVHIFWIVAAALLAAFLARGAVPAVFLAVFFVVWLLGFGVMEKVYR